MSNLETLSGYKLELDLVQKIIKDYNVLPTVLCWCAIKNLHTHSYQLWENKHLLFVSKTADTAAKSALSLSITNIKFALAVRWWLLTDF